MDLLSLLTTLDHKSALFYIVLAVYLITKIAPLLTEKHKSAKIEKYSNLIDMATKKAKQIVVPIANEVGLSNADRREKAVTTLYRFLSSRGLKVNRSDLYAVTETAYKYMKSNGFLDDKQPEKTGNPEDLTQAQLDYLTPDIKGE